MTLVFAGTVVQMWDDPTYVQSLHLPPDGVHLVGGFAAAAVEGFFWFVHLVCHVVFMVICFTSLRHEKIDLLGFIPKRDGVLTNVVRTMGLLSSVYLVYTYMANYFRFYPLEPLWHVAVILVIFLYTDWLVAFIKVKRWR